MSDTLDLLDDYPDVDKPSCRLLGPTALIVQGLMGILVILSLVYKRHRETHKRPWRIWLFDVSKQIVGQMFVHGVNVLISDIVAHLTTSNACVFYFLNILVDTTLGVALIYIILHVLTNLLSEKMHLKGFESGEYGSPPSLLFWARQASVYVLSLTTMKLLVIALFAIFPGIFTIGEWLLSWTWTGDGDSLQVIFTMGLFPIIMNIVQFWLIDSIVKANKDSIVALSSDSPRGSFDSPDHEPLFAASSDDEDDDTPAARPRYDLENPPPRPSSQSESQNKSAAGQSTPDEYKTSPSDTPGTLIATHAYPPSVASDSSPPKDSSPKLARKMSKRRSPPPPLYINSPAQPAVNSPQLSGIAIPQPTIVAAQTKSDPKVTEFNDTKEWVESWDDSDDWANRVGEEEWTGRRLEEKKGALSSAWVNSVAKVGMT